MVPRIAIGAAVALALVLVLTGWDQVADISGTLITIAAAGLMLVRAISREPRQALPALALAALAGQVLSELDWPSVSGFTMVAVAMVFLHSVKGRQKPRSPDAFSGNWRLGTRLE